VLDFLNKRRALCAHILLDCIALMSPVNSQEARNVVSLEAYREKSPRQSINTERQAQHSNTEEIANTQAVVRTGLALFRLKTEFIQELPEMVRTLCVIARDYEAVKNDPEKEVLKRKLEQTWLARGREFDQKRCYWRQQLLSAKFKLAKIPGQKKRIKERINQHHDALWYGAPHQISVYPEEGELDYFLEFLRINRRL